MMTFIFFAALVAALIRMAYLEHALHRHQEHIRSLQRQLSQQRDITDIWAYPTKKDK